MLTSLQNMDAVHKQGRILTITCVIGMIAVAVFAITYVTNAVQEQSQVVYALMGDNAISLRAISVTENRPVEAYNHVDLFHRSFFNLDPDRAVIDQNINRSLSLGDQSVRSLFQDYEEDGYYRKLIASNTSQRVHLDSISLNLDSEPYSFQFTGKVIITRPSTVVTRSLITEGFFRDVQRSKANPHGFLIERFRVIDNEDLSVVRRY